MKIKFKKMRENAQAPFRGSDGAAGYDLFASGAEQSFGKIKYLTGVAVEIPKGYVGLVFPRSSVYRKDLRMSNCVGVIDSDYRGEISAVFDCKEAEGDVYAIGERCCQLVIVPCLEVDFEEAESLSETERGSNGYGSTGA